MKVKPEKDNSTLTPERVQADKIENAVGAVALGYTAEETEERLAEFQAESGATDAEIDDIRQLLMRERQRLHEELGEDGCIAALPDMLAAGMDELHLVAPDVSGSAEFDTSRVPPRLVVEITAMKSRFSLAEIYGKIALHQALTGLSDEATAALRKCFSAGGEGAGALKRPTETEDEWADRIAGKEAITPAMQGLIDTVMGYTDEGLEESLQEFECKTRDNPAAIRVLRQGIAEAKAHIKAGARRVKPSVKANNQAAIRSLRQGIAEADIQAETGASEAGNRLLCGLADRMADHMARWSEAEVDELLERYQRETDVTPDALASLRTEINARRARLNNN